MSARECVAELQAGRAGGAFTAELQRTIRAVAVARNFPPPEGHAAWDADAVWSTASEFMADAQTPRRLTDLAVHCASADALRARLQGTVRNFLADLGPAHADRQAGGPDQRRPAGRARVRAVGGRWARAARTGPAARPASTTPTPWAGPSPASTVVVPAWGHDAHRAAPVADRDTIVVPVRRPARRRRRLAHAPGPGPGHRPPAGRRARRRCRWRSPPSTGRRRRRRRGAGRQHRRRGPPPAAGGRGAGPAQRPGAPGRRLPRAHRPPAGPRAGRQPVPVPRRPGPGGARSSASSWSTTTTPRASPCWSWSWAGMWADTRGQRRRIRRSGRAMSVFGPAHPLDVDLADLVDGLLDDARAAEVEAHLADCLLCRLQRRTPARRARRPPSTVGRALPAPAFAVPAVDGAARRSRRSTSSGWPAPTTRLLVLVLRASHGRPGPGRPRHLRRRGGRRRDPRGRRGRLALGTGLAVHPRLATEVPRRRAPGRAAWVARRSTWPAPAGRRPSPAPTDPRLEVRQLLADRLGVARRARRPTRPPAPTRRRPGPSRSGRRSSPTCAPCGARMCTVRPLDGWGDVLARPPGGMGADRHRRRGRHRAGGVRHAPRPGRRRRLRRRPLGAHPLQRHRPGRAGRRASATLAEVFDSSSLNYGIDAPSGRHTAAPPPHLRPGPVRRHRQVPRPELRRPGGGARRRGARSPGSTSTTSCGRRRRAAVADAVRQGARFKIVPKRRGYESLAGAEDGAGGGPGPRLRPRAVGRPGPARPGRDRPAR